MQGDWELEKQLRKQEKAPVKRDQANWIDHIAADGSWDSIKLLRRGRRKQQGRLRNAGGQEVSSEKSAETLADHLESIQWKGRPTTQTSNELPVIRITLPVEVGPFTNSELRKAIKSLKYGKR